jgi:hypothetical protein
MQFIEMPASKWAAERDHDINWHYWGTWALIGIAFHLIVPIGAYFHAFKGSYIALGFILAIGSLMVLAVAIPFLIGSTFGDHFWLGVAPGVLAIVTMVLAIINTVAYLQHKQDL